MDIPQRLKESLKDGKLIPFVGAGVSMAVLATSNKQPLFPSWKALLLAAADALEHGHKPDQAGIVRGMVNTNRLLEAAKEAQSALAANWHVFLKKQLDPTSDQAEDASLELARRVWQLGSRLIITTNYDNVLHWACPQAKDLAKWNIEASAEQAALLRNGVSKPTVWHLHGHIDDSANIILTPDGYQRLYVNGSEQRYQAALQTLRQQLSSHSFLFIGFSLADEEFTDQLRLLDDIYPGASGPHYLLLPESQRNHFQPPVPAIEPVFFSDYGQALLDCLQQMMDSIPSPRPWGEGSGVRVKEPWLLTDSSYSANAFSPTEEGLIADFSPDKPVFNVPFRAKGEQMVGRRDALEQVRSQLCHGKRTSIGQTAAFQGLGGLGKTQLAVEYAYVYRNEYPNGVIWLNADQDLTAQLIKLAEDARWVSPLSDQPYKIQVALRRLQETSDCLIIFDNLEQLTDIESFLPKLPASPHLLVTSRIEQAGFPPVPLDTLSPELGLQLLLQEAGRAADNAEEIQAARDIVQHLDGLPLALELAGAYLRRRQTVSWAQYLQLLRDNLKSAFPANLREDSLTRHEADIYSTLKLSEMLFQEEPLLRDVLDLLTWSGSAPMALPLLCAALGQDKPSALTGALSLGVALRILQKPKDAEHYAIHRLLREVRREEVPLKQRRDWAEACCQRLGDWFATHRKEFRDLPIFEAGLDHLEAWRQNAECLRFTLLAVRLLWLQAYPPYHWGRYAEAKRDVERALALYEQAALSDVALQAHLFNDLACVISEMGNNKAALSLAKRALAIRCELYGEEHADTAISLANLASYHGELGEYDEALRLGQQALEIRFRLFGEAHPDTAISLNNVASYYSELRKYAKALELGQQALDIQRLLFGDEHPDTATSLSNVAASLGNMGRMDAAFKHRQQALLIRQKLLGETHPKTILSQHRVIHDLCHMGRKPEAIQRFQTIFPRLKPGDPYCQDFMKLRAELFPGYRKPSKNKKRR